MSQATLNELSLIPDIISLREIIVNDPEITQIPGELSKIGHDLVIMQSNVAVPVLDLNPESIKQANQWLAYTQGYKDRITYHRNLLDGYDHKIAIYWNLGHNILMIQPSIEALRSNDQRMVYVEHIFEDVNGIKFNRLRRDIKFIMRKMETIEKNLQDGFWNLQQQQRNLQLIAQMNKAIPNY